MVDHHIDTAGLIKCNCNDWLAVAEFCDGELDGGVSSLG